MEVLAEENAEKENENSSNRANVDNKSSEPEEEKICPKCGSKLVVRVATKGDNAGNKFWGCSGFPKCRYIENIK